MLKNKSILGIFIFIIALFVGSYFYNQLPDMIATHWNINGNVDGYTSKTLFIFGLPVFFMFIYLFTLFFITKDPKYANNKGKKIITITCISIPLIFLVLYSSSIYVALGNNLDITKITIIFVGLLLIVLGIFLPNTEQNYSIGYKTPWALDDKDNWNKTNRLASKIFIIMGICLIVSIVLKYLVYFTIAISVIPFIYSYYLYNKKNKGL